MYVEEMFERTMGKLGVGKLMTLFARRMHASLHGLHEACARPACLLSLPYEEIQALNERHLLMLRGRALQPQPAGASSAASPANDFMAVCDALGISCFIVMSSPLENPVPSDSGVGTPMSTLCAMCLIAADISAEDNCDCSSCSRADSSTALLKNEVLRP